MSSKQFLELMSTRPLNFKFVVNPWPGSIYGIRWYLFKLFFRLRTKTTFIKGHLVPLMASPWIARVFLSTAREKKDSPIRIDWLDLSGEEIFSGLTSKIGRYKTHLSLSRTQGANRTRKKFDSFQGP